jgi:phosphoenolpyruvate phosphomutase
MQNTHSETHASHLGCASPSETQHANGLFDGTYKIGIGVYDGLSALLAEKGKFDFAWVSSFCCSAALGIPDAGIVGPEEILSVVRCVRRSIVLPIVVDLDSGYGDAVKVFHVVEAMARAGAAALCIEDNPASKRCSLYDRDERLLASPEEHIMRLRAARAAIDALGADCRIIARTEALVAGMGLPEALRRAEAYAHAGADAVFVQSLDSSGHEVLEFGRAWMGRTPVVIAPTRLPHITRTQFKAAGISHHIFANQGIRAAHKAMSDTFAALSEAECSLEAERTISSVQDVATSVGAQKVFEMETRFAKNGGASRQPRRQTPLKSLRNSRSKPARISGARRVLK